MQEEYFFVESNQIFSKYLILENDEAKHISRVLRKSIGDSIWVVDGKENAYKTVISKIDKSLVECEIVSKHQKQNESKIEITLAFSILKNPARNDLIIEKCTELGVKYFIPIISQRTISNKAKQSRWEQIALSSMKQSGRCWLPEIKQLSNFKELIFSAKNYDLKIIPHEKIFDNINIPELKIKHHNLKSVLIIIGPEGGFAEDEIQFAEENNFNAVSLGNRRLRSETAAIASVTITII